MSWLNFGSDPEHILDILSYLEIQATIALRPPARPFAISHCHAPGHTNLPTDGLLDIDSISCLMWKWKWRWETSCSAVLGKSSLMYLLFAGNDTADFDVAWWRYALCWVLSSYIWMHTLSIWTSASRLPHWLRCSSWHQPREYSLNVGLSLSTNLTHVVSQLQYLQWRRSIRFIFTKIFGKLW